jgi:hypothetical protein
VRKESLLGVTFLGKLDGNHKTLHVTNMGGLKVGGSFTLARARKCQVSGEARLMNSLRDLPHPFLVIHDGVHDSSIHPLPSSPSITHSNS